MHTELPTLGEMLVRRVHDLQTWTQRIQRRSAILVESSQHARARTTLVAQCAWCGRVRVGGVWAQHDEVPAFLAALLGNRRTHGICPTCFEQLQRDAATGPLPASVVLVRAAGPLAIECLSRALEGYVVRERPSLALEVTLPDAGGATVSTLLSTISGCLEANRLEPVTIELADETYVLGDGGRVRDGA
jgi:hypothetical protein